MALRSPSTFHNYWGIVATSSALPNAPGYVLTSSPLSLQHGDIAFVSGESTLYVCTNPGTVNNGGDATWAPLYSGLDHFAPKYVVGSADDSQIPFSVGGFYYFPDDGTGNGIQAALDHIGLGNPLGDIYVRPGTYDLTARSAANQLPFVIPDGCKVQGAGDITYLTYVLAEGGTTTVFLLGTGSELRDVRIEVQDSGDVLTGTDGRSIIQCESLDRVYCTRVKISILLNFTSAASALDSCVWVNQGTLYLDTCYLSFYFGGDFNDNPEFGGRAGLRAVSEAIVYRCNISGKDFGIVSSTGSPQRLLVDQSVVFGATAIYSTGYANVTGATELTAWADANPAYGVRVVQPFTPGATLSVNGSRIVLSSTNPASTGIKSEATTGQIIGSNIVSATGIGIDTSASTGAGHAIGFNVIQASVGNEIISALMDEVAHNIFA